MSLDNGLDKPLLREQTPSEKTTPPAVLKEAQREHRQWLFSLRADFLNLAYSDPASDLHPPHQALQLYLNEKSPPLEALKKKLRRVNSQLKKTQALASQERLMREERALAEQVYDSESAFDRGRQELESKLHQAEDRLFSPCTQTVGQKSADRATLYLNRMYSSFTGGFYDFVLADVQRTLEIPVGTFEKTLALHFEERVYRQRKNFPAARKARRRALSLLEPTPERAVEFAEIFLEENDLPSAEKYLNKALQKSPENSKAHLLLDQLKKTKEAALHYELELAKRDREKSCYQKALECYARAQELFPDRYTIQLACKQTELESAIKIFRTIRRRWRRIAAYSSAREAVETLYQKIQDLSKESGIVFSFNELEKLEGYIDQANQYFYEHLLGKARFQSSPGSLAELNQAIHKYATKKGGLQQPAWLVDQNPISPRKPRFFEKGSRRSKWVKMMSRNIAEYAQQTRDTGFHFLYSV